MACPWGDHSPAQWFPEKGFGSGVQLGGGDQTPETFTWSSFGTPTFIHVLFPKETATLVTPAFCTEGIGVQGPIRHLLLIKLS